MNVGLLGLGVVGSEVARALFSGLPGFDLTRVAVASGAKARRLDIPSGVLSTDSEEVVKDPDIDVVIEVIGGFEPARSLIAEALAHGKSVVTTNSEVIAASGHELLDLAEANGVSLLFEGTVCGGVPILSVINHGLLGDRITAVEGIVNGTTNHILTKMSTRFTSFEDALADAQRLGYTERDPANDLSGRDAVNRLCIMASFAFGQWIEPDEVYRLGIETVTHRDLAAARRVGHTIKLLASARKVDDQIHATVRPVALLAGHALARLGGAISGVILEAELAGKVFFSGNASGGVNAASAVLGDLVRLMNHATDDASSKHNIVRPGGSPPTEPESGFLIAGDLNGGDKELGQLKAVLSKKGIVVDRLDQDRGSIVGMTQVTSRAKLVGALELAQKDELLVSSGVTPLG